MRDVRTPAYGSHSVGAAPAGEEAIRLGDESMKLLFVVNEAGEFVELSRVAKAAQAKGHRIIFLFAPTSYHRLKNHRKICKQNGFEAHFFAARGKFSKRDEEIAINEAGLKEGYLPWSLAQSVNEQRPNFWFKLKLWGALSILVPLLVFSRFVNVRPAVLKKVIPTPNFSYLKSLFYAEKIYRSVKPDLVILGQEFPGSANSWLVKVCHRDGVPSVIVPFAVGTTKEMVESLHDKPEYNADIGFFNRVAARLFPNWVNFYRGKALLRLPGKSILLLEYLGIAPDHPWIPNQSRRLSAIAVESVEMLRHYQRMRFPESQLRLTGAAYDDLLFHGKKSVEQTRFLISKDLNIDPLKKLLVCAWPTDQYGSRNIPMEFSNYRTLCEAWASSLARVANLSDFEVIICPHPVTDRSLLAEVLIPHGLYTHVTELDTLKVVPCADLFVACVSSTIRWAISLGTPVVNYDCYEYGYTDFDAGPGVFTVTAFYEFDRKLQSLTRDPQELEGARQSQLSCAPDWGCHDGHSVDRILALFDEVSAVRRRRVKQSAFIN